MASPHVRELEQAFVVADANGQAVAYTYFRRDENKARQSACPDPRLDAVEILRRDDRDLIQVSPQAPPRGAGARNFRLKPITDPKLSDVLDCPKA